LQRRFDAFWRYGGGGAMVVLDCCVRRFGRGSIVS